MTFAARRPQFKKIMGYIESGKAEGAKCLLGGNRLGDKGYYVAPTIFSGVTDGMKSARPSPPTSPPPPSCPATAARPRATAADQPTSGPP